MAVSHLPVGKLPPTLLDKLLGQFSKDDPSVLLGPGTGLDCAVLDLESTLLIVKSDPITFTDKDIAWYLVHVNANDIATTGAIPKWLMVTMLLPESRTTEQMVMEIGSQLREVCDQIGISIIGGHTEITHGLAQPILVGTMLAASSREDLISPNGIQAGDELILTKGVPIEATALAAREFRSQLSNDLEENELAAAESFLLKPGISIIRDAQLALKAGKVTGMHDPTEGGLLAALWEMAKASGRSVVFDPAAVPVPDLSQKICQALKINPLAAVSSGALLIAVRPGESLRVLNQLTDAGIACSRIGHFEEGDPFVFEIDGSERLLADWPDRDEIARLLVEKGKGS